MAKGKAPARRLHLRRGWSVSVPAPGRASKTAPVRLPTARTFTRCLSNHPTRAPVSLTASSETATSLGPFRQANTSAPTAPTGTSRHLRAGFAATAPAGSH